MKNSEMIKFNDKKYEVAFKSAEIQFPEYETMKAQVDALHTEFMQWKATPENLKSSKEVRSKLNKLRKAINDRKIEIVNQANKPVKEFQSQIKAMTDEIDETSKYISAQIKAFDRKAAADKHERHMKFIKKACEDAGVDYTKIEYNEKWDNKTSFSNLQFESAVDQQISVLLEEKKNYQDNLTVLVEKADKLALNADTYKQLFDSGMPLNKVLNQMDDDKAIIVENAKKHEEFKKQQQADLKKQGTKAYDPETGEIKDKLYDFRLSFEQISPDDLVKLASFLKDWSFKENIITADLTGTKEQVEQLSSFLQRNNIKARRVK